MSILAPASAVWSGRMLAVFRVVAGLMFITSGTMKLFGYPPNPVSRPPLDLTSQVGVAGVLETMGGLAIVLGALTRRVSFVLTGMMAVAYFQFHAPRLTFAGAGVWSVDARLARARRGDPSGSSSHSEFEPIHQ